MMKALTCLIFVNIGLILKISSSSELKTEDYVQMIMDLYDFYHPSSVLLVYFADIDSPPEMNIVFKVMLMLSKRRILTMATPLQEIQPAGNYFDTRSMSVILFTSGKSIEKLKQFSEKIDLYESINLIIFMANDESLKESCVELLQNKLQFSLEATILIRCYNEENIKRWYPFEKKGMEFVTWAHWEPNTNLILEINNPKHPKQGDLGGKILRIATVKSSYFTEWKNEKLVGYLGEVLHMLEELMNFKAEHVKEEDEFGSFNESTQTWSGVMGLAATNEVDLVVSGLILSRERSDHVDLSVPIYSTQDTLYVKEPSNNKAIVWSAYFQPFNNNIWLIIFLLILIAPLVITLMKRKLNNSYSLSENYLNVWSIYCQQGLKEFPTMLSLRLAYLSIFICSFIIMALYSASLISYLTVPTSNLPFSNLEGFVRDGSYDLIVARDGNEYDMIRNSNETIFIKMNELMLPKEELPLTEDDGFDMVCKRKVAFYDTEVSGERSNMNISCQVVRISAERTDHGGMVFSKRCPYTKMINYQKVIELKNDNFDNVSFSGIAILLVILAVGIMLGIIILFLERMYFNHILENIDMRSDLTLR